MSKKPGKRTVVNSQNFSLRSRFWFPWMELRRNRTLCIGVSVGLGWGLLTLAPEVRWEVKLERPGPKRAWLRKLGGFDLLLVYRTDCLSRSVRGLTEVLEYLDTVGVSIRSAAKPFDTPSPAGRMMVLVLGVFAEFEQATIDRERASATSITC